VGNDDRTNVEEGGARGNKADTSMNARWDDRWREAVRARDDTDDSGDVLLAGIASASANTPMCEGCPCVAAQLTLHWSSGCLVNCAQFLQLDTAPCVCPPFSLDRPVSWEELI
jgi:hypothetical protein